MAARWLLTGVVCMSHSLTMTPSRTNNLFLPAFPLRPLQKQPLLPHRPAEGGRDRSSSNTTADNIMTPAGESHGESGVGGGGIVSPGISPRVRKAMAHMRLDTAAAASHGPPPMSRTPKQPPTKRAQLVPRRYVSVSLDASLGICERSFRSMHVCARF